MKALRHNEIDVEKWLEGTFAKNYHRLRIESGHALSPEVREAARQQVLYYWRKLRTLAESITDTEVRLHLPNQKSKAGRKFGIEGVVDIVRESERTTMYDLKTHDPDYVRQNLVEYERQLNVYAYIWSILRGQPLTDTAVITTQFPQSLSDAIRSGDRARIDEEVSKWEPVVPIDFAQDHVMRTVEEFGEVIDKIEAGEFQPPTVAMLRKEEVKGRSFASRVCRNCDIRFSCSSFRKYSMGLPREINRGSMKFVLQNITDDEREEIFEAGLA
jgi:hypothetical protein